MITLPYQNKLQFIFDINLQEADYEVTGLKGEKFQIEKMYQL